MILEFKKKKKKKKNSTSNFLLIWKKIKKSRGIKNNPEKEDGLAYREFRI